MFDEHWQVRAVMEVFDSLPAGVRRELARARHNIDPRAVSIVVEQMGIEAAVEYIRRKDQNLESRAKNHQAA
jgi:hypothetical protein